MNTNFFRESCASKLDQLGPNSARMSAFVGLDGFVDEILQVVSLRRSADDFDRFTTITDFATRLLEAAGRSTNVELVQERVKLGGNGPIMANALATFGLDVTYLGCLGYPTLHPVFHDFAARAKVHSICEPGKTDALEFSDGKVMLGKHYTLKEVNWKNIEERYGRAPFTEQLGGATLVAFVNWTMLPYMSAIWETVLDELCPSLNGPKRTIFFDLADPQKRSDSDILHAMELVQRFQKYFNVILGLNEKEAEHVGRVLGFPADHLDREGLSILTGQIYNSMRIDTLVVHPVRYAIAAGPEGVISVDGPVVTKPKITTGAGDHFNSGFCLGKLLGLSNEASLLCGVSTSGFYVRSAQSPTLPDLSGMMREWPGA